MLLYEDRYCGIRIVSDDFVHLFKMHPLVDEVVVAETVKERLEASMKKHNIKRGFSSFEEWLEKAPDVDCIGIFTQRHLHGSMIVHAMESGKHVYSAVPIGCTVEEIE